MSGKDLLPQPQMEAAAPEGTCQRSGASQVLRWCCRQPGRFGEERREDSPAESHQWYRHDPRWGLTPTSLPAPPARSVFTSTHTRSRRHAEPGAVKGFASGSAAAVRLLRQAGSQRPFSWHPAGRD